MNDEPRGIVDTFKYLYATLMKDVQSEKEINIMATETSALVSLSTIWKSRNISLYTKIVLYKSLILSILLYGCETWTLPE